MDAHYTKTTRPDPNSESGTYSDCALVKGVEFCCDKFKEFSKKFPSWSYEHGRFTIVDQITYDGQTSTAINYCPFCGKKIKYKEIKSKTRTH